MEDLTENQVSYIKGKVPYDSPIQIIFIEFFFNFLQNNSWLWTVQSVEAIDFLD